ncbi:hypothetical protein [Gymnodinialimonas ceratoperidinii]|uniref:Secreted protein n=1 Tax=Gymnodinialimonas ceratoperidinii TaxID=2856823 RepID=A0A8F6YDS9_9RHOB|nr:hypothetical protein [Gymnodinialimonas ceratoperidinii]QXT40825.1 hypothetical protein KYE46_06220 [Gymnodinialimonas ceratoperidinii]
MFRALFSATLIVLSGAAASLAPLQAQATGHGCLQVQFPRGAYAHTVHGHANAHRSQCYYLSVRPGQLARVQVTYGPVFFSTTHTHGNYTNVEFRTVNGDLYVYVHTDYAGSQPYGIEFVFV